MRLYFKAQNQYYTRCLPTDIIIMKTILSLCLGFVFGTLAEAKNSNKNTSSINECVPAVNIKWPAEVSKGVCIPYQAMFPNGICKDVMGYQPVYGINIKDLENHEYGQTNYQLVNAVVGQDSSANNPVDNSTGKRCRKMDTDMTCHERFKRCYISSSPQLPCREICEDLKSNICKQEYKLMEQFEKERAASGYPLGFIIRDCINFPFRNESPNCYYPDEIRDKLNVLESKDCFYGDGRGYRGNRSVTKSGYTCQSWNAQCPHRHNINGTIYKELSGNLCRNPGGYALDGPWCFTTNRTVRWEYCDVPKCLERPPSSPPSNFRGYNTSSTSVKLTWGDVPKNHIHGVLFGFHVVCERVNNVSDRHLKELTEHEWIFKGLQKYSNYSCQLRAYNNFGIGNWSGKLVISTDEDVPGSAPGNLKVRNKTSTSFHVEWEPIPVEYQHGEILGYKVEITAEEQNGQKSRRKVTNNWFTESRSLVFNSIENYRYVISVSGVTRRGEGPARSLTVQVDGQPDKMPDTDHSTGTSQSTIVSIVLAAVLPGTVALGAALLVIHFVCKRKKSSHQRESHQGNGPGSTVAPYAVSSPDWIERIINNHCHLNEMTDNVPSTTRKPSYINIGADGSLNLPPYTNDIVLEFQPMYENTRYQMLHPRTSERRLLAGAVDEHGNPVYDKLIRGNRPRAISQGNGCNKEKQKINASKKERKQRCHSVDLGELRRLNGNLQGDALNKEMTEKSTCKQRCQRPFSVDLAFGPRNEFIL